MSRALIDILVYVLAPLVIGCVCLLKRHDTRQAILVLSIIALALGGFDFIVYYLELADIIPIVSPAPNYALIDSFRIVCNGIAFYAGLAALALALHRAAQTGRLGWMTALIIIAMVALVSAGIAGSPLVFFSRLGYTRIEAVAFAAGGHLLAFVTMIYALATLHDTVPAAPMPVMYPPMIYPPMMYPPPAPYGPPVSYAPPPPVVLPAPQPQPPTMTTPS